MKILVTGAGGFVCRHMVAALAHAGHEVVALDQHFDADLPLLWGRTVRLISADTTNLPDESFDVVIHGAALTASAEALDLTPAQHLRANLDPALTVMDWALDHARRALYISSSAVYRTMPPGFIDESVPAVPEGTYALAKYNIEGLVETYRAERSVDWTAIRLSNVYGPGEVIRTTRPRLSLLGQMIHDAVQGQAVTVYAFEAAREWTLVSDIGQAVAALIAAPRWQSPLYHMASGQMASPVQLAELVAQCIPGAVFQFVEHRPVDRPVLTRVGALGSARLSAEPGFSSNLWTPLYEGIQQTVAWLQARQTITANEAV